MERGYVALTPFRKQTEKERQQLGEWSLNNLTTAAIAAITKEDQSKMA